jgi:MFS family permease
MVSTVLPIYLLYTVGLTPLQFGVIDGIYQGGAALVRVASGFVADRTQRHKEVALAGYGLSALCRPLLIAFGSVWGALAAVIFVDRTGKGIRTAPRDALISLTTPKERLGTAFGVHRALDTTGAMIGPLIAFGLLMLVPEGFNSVFVVSFVFALLGVAVLALFVRNPPRARRRACSGAGASRSSRSPPRCSRCSPSATASST